MKICILTPRFPFPENGGDVLRINGIAKYLKSRGHKLCLVSFVENLNIPQREAFALYDTIHIVKRKTWQSIVHSLLFFLKGKPIQCGYYYSDSFLEKIKTVKTVEQPDLYVCHLLRTTIYAQRLGLEKRTIIEMTDALSKTYSKASASKGFSIKKLIYYFEESKIRKYEDSVIIKFPKVVLVSNGDVNYLQQRQIMGVNSLVVHSNGVELPKVRSTHYDNNKICFIGNMRTLQNQDAVFRFVKEIFPLILEKKPHAVFYIVGAEPPAKIKKLCSKNVVVTGFVTDIFEIISDACIAVAPIHIAAGIQNKVLFAMGAGVPVVLTSLISKAIPELKNGENCSICDESKEFADGCLEIMDSKIIREQYSYKSYKIVEDYYSWLSKLEGYEIFPH